jgi:hypothetical protein
MRRSLGFAVSILALLMFFTVPVAHAQSPSTTPRISLDSSPIVNAAVKHDVSPPLRDIKPVRHAAKGKEMDNLTLPRLPQGAPNGIPDNIQDTPTTPLTPAPSNSFDGIGNGFTGPQGTFTVNSAPPDTNGAVGPQDYVQIVNTDFAVFNKDATRGAIGSVRFGPVQINTLWSGFGGLCQADNDGDPIVVYDSIANRWLITQFAVTNANPNFFQCIAVSTGSDPTGSFNRYAFSYPNFPDYPKFGLWPDAYYATFNMFNAAGTSFLGGQVCAFDRAKMLTGASATQVCFNAGTSFGSLLPSSLDGATLPPAGSPNYVLALNTTTSLAFWKFHVDFTTPSNSTFTGPTSIPVASYAEACGGGTCIPQSGTTNQLDSLADRLMYRLAYRNFGDHESLVVDHAVTVGSSAGMRWYEIRNPGGTPTVFQSGTYAPDSSFRWMGSIAEDQSGDMAMGFSISSSSTHPGISYTGRLVSDPLGSMAQGETSVIVGGGSQTGTLTRWGDYSAMQVDPSDGCTFWYTNEYIPANGSFNWKTRIASFKFPSCGGSTGGNDFSISANPSSLSIAQGSNGTSTISTAVTSGSAGTVSLTASVSPSGPTASLNPTSVTAGGSSTLTVTVGSTVATGTYTVTVTGTEGSASHSTAVTVTVTAGGGGGSQLIVNGGFENGQAPWQESSSGGFQLIDPTNPHTGAESAFLCGYNNCNDQIWQSVTLPSSVTHVTLTFWWFMSTRETSTSTCFDFFRVRIRTSSGSVISTPFSKCNVNANNTWQQVTLDLTSILQSHAGQTIQILFQGTTDSSLITSVFVDDVALNVS